MASHLLSCVTGMWDIYAEDQRVIPPSCNGINLVEKNHPCWDIQQQPKSLIGHTIAGIRSPSKKAWNFPTTIGRVGCISPKMGKFLVKERSAWGLRYDSVDFQELTPEKLFPSSSEMRARTMTQSILTWGAVSPIRPDKVNWFSLNLTVLTWI